MKTNIRVAVLDLYNGTPNMGMKNITNMVRKVLPDAELDIFDVRQKGELPGLHYPIYISSGGPGDPLLNDGPWFDRYFDWLEDLLSFNRYSSQPKYAFFICHSFQMLCHYLEVGVVRKRTKKSFGIYPVRLLSRGFKDEIFKNLPNPFYAADFREFQVFGLERIPHEKFDVKVLAQEIYDHRHFRTHALMGIRVGETIWGTQFHPEADPQGMTNYAMKEEWRNLISKQYGEELYWEMIGHLEDPEKIKFTFDTVIPEFLNQAVAKTVDYTVLVS